MTHAGCKRMYRKLYRKLGKYIVISTENKRNCIPVQYLAKQTFMNEELKDDQE
jgi:hypothetical protein